MLARLLLPLLLVLPILPGCASAGDQDPNLARYQATPLRIATSSGRLHRFDVYLAVKPEDQRRGLMFVRELPADEGMLFVHNTARQLSMWMKNTFLPLDMLFIRENGEIASIVADTVPQSLDSIRSREPVTAVLELNAGTAARLKINPGDKVLHPAFSQ